MLQDNDYLVFRLYGPMASWGEIAVGETRHSATHPSKSALLGLIAAALGIERTDEARQSALAGGYQFAVKQLSAGQILRDYHTTQVPRSVGKFSYRTRRDELVVGKDLLGTSLSSREYRTDPVAIVAIKALSNAPHSLSEILDALLRPKFHLYLGRKSCPLAAPLDPQIVSAAQGARLALDSYHLKPVVISGRGDRTASLAGDHRWLSANEQTHYYWEGTMEDFSADPLTLDAPKVQTLTRHDQPLSRQRWQFSPRLEHSYCCEPNAGDLLQENK